MLEFFQNWTKKILDYIPPWLIKIVEKWLFGHFYIVFSAISWLFGGGLWNWFLSNFIFLIGSYYVASIVFDFISHWIVEMAEINELSRNPAIKDLMMRAQYPPYSRALYNKYKNWEICQMIVGRHPMMTFARKCLNFFSNGKWDEVAQELFNSEIQHSLLLLVLRSPTGDIKLIRLHKTQVVAISDEYTILSNTILKNVPNVRNKGLTLEKLLEKACEQNKKSFLTFKILDNNCQRFIEYILDKNELLTEELREFIIQDLTRMENKIPIYITPVSEFVIFIARLFVYILYLK